MSDENASKSHRTQIIVAVITLVSGVTIAIISNADKLFPKPTNTNANVPVVSPQPNNQKRNDDVTDPKDFTDTHLIGHWRTVTPAFTINLRLHGSHDFDNDMTYTNQATILATGTWTYSNGVYAQYAKDGTSLKGDVEWIDRDTFDFTMTQINQMPPTSLQRVRYRRQ